MRLLQKKKKKKRTSDKCLWTRGRMSGGCEGADVWYDMTGVVLHECLCIISSSSPTSSAASPDTVSVWPFNSVVGVAVSPGDQARTSPSRHAVSTRSASGKCATRVTGFG